jgi:hypothetical protein
VSETKDLILIHVLLIKSVARMRTGKDVLAVGKI